MNMCEINEIDIETVMILVNKLYMKEGVSINEYKYMQIVLDCCLPIVQYVCDDFCTKS